MVRNHANALLFVAGVLLALGAGGVVFLLAPVLGMGRAVARGVPAPRPAPRPRLARPSVGVPRLPRIHLPRMHASLPRVEMRLPRLGAPRLTRLASHPVWWLRACVWWRPELVWCALAVGAALLVGILIGLRG
jgi:hypothetical protein